MWLVCDTLKLPPKLSPGLAWDPSLSWGTSGTCRRCISSHCPQAHSPREWTYTSASPASRLSFWRRPGRSSRTALRGISFRTMFSVCSGAGKVSTKYLRSECDLEPGPSRPHRSLSVQWEPSVSYSRPPSLTSRVSYIWALSLNSEGTRYWPLFHTIWTARTEVRQAEVT